MYAIGPKIIASYHSQSFHIDFTKSAGDVFAACVLNESVVQYPLDPSVNTIQAVPIDLRMSKGKTVKWLLNNQYFPIIQDGRIAFHFRSISFGLERSFEDFFTESQPRIPLDPSPDIQDIEGHYSKCLHRAKQQNYVEEQIFCLKKISDLYLQNKKFLTAAKLLNCAVVIASAIPYIRNYLFSRLEIIEELFLKSNHLEIPLQRKQSIQEYRHSLERCRSAAKVSTEPIHKTLNTLTQDFKKILKTFIFEAMDIMGVPPTKWACMGMGSMARGEMCPYSDIEFVFLVEDDDEKSMDYFRVLSQVLELKIVNLGETKFPIFGEKYPSPTPDGFCMDSAGNTPLGVPGIYELIGTPKMLARFQTEEWIDRNIILSNAIGFICFIAGDQRLIKNYQAERALILNQKESFFGETFGQKFAIRLLVGHLKEFFPDLSENKEKHGGFGIKKELYRPFQEIISCLALFYDLKVTNTLERVQELVKIGVFCTEGGENLQKAISQVLLLRMQAHLFYQNEEEVLCYAEAQQDQEPGLMYLNQQHIATIHTIYKVLIPFCQSMKQFCLKREKSVLNKLTFYDQSLKQEAICDSPFQYQRAQVAYRQALSLNPNNIEALLGIATLAMEFGDIQGGFMRVQKILSMAQEISGEQRIILGKAYSIFADGLSTLGQHKEAFEHYKKSQLVYQELLLQSGDCAEQNLLYNVCQSYLNLGKALKNLDRYQEALDQYQIAQEGFNLFSRGKESCELISCYTGIAETLEKIGNLEQAWENHQKAIKGAESFKFSRGKESGNPAISSSYASTGAFFYNQGNYGESFKFYDKALSIDALALQSDKPNPRLAKRYQDAGNVLIKLKSYQEALRCFQTALKIYLKIYGENYPEVATNYHDIGFSYANLGAKNQALEYYQKALKITLSALGENHPDVAAIYNNIGFIYYDLGKNDDALKFYQKALRIKLHIYKKNHPTIETGLKNLLSCVEKASSSSFKDLQEICILCQQILGIEHSLVQTLSQLLP